VRRIVDIVLAVLATAAVAAAVVQLHAARDGVVIRTAQVGATPVEVVRDPDAPPGPAVVIAHGFAGSKQLMRSFALTLARAGYTAVAFDFLGHGRHPEPLTGSITETAGATTALLAQLEEVAAWARELESTDGRLALLGHSMATDIIVRYAQREEHDVAATVAVSMLAPSVEAASPENLLVIVGGWENRLEEEARRVLAQITDDPELGVTYGEPATGTGRRAVVAPDVEHVGVLFSPASQRAALAWLNEVFGREDASGVAKRGWAILLLLAGLVALARPLARLLPPAAARPVGAGAPWRRLWLPLVAPAALTPLILVPLDVSFLPVLVGDYLALHFFVYGLLTIIGLGWLHRGGVTVTTFAETRPGALVVATVLLVGYGLGVMGAALDLTVTSFWPVGERVPLVAALAAGTLVYTVANEWLTRGGEAPKGAGVASKLLFAASLVLAAVLDLERLFFLLIIVPVIVVFFVVYGLFAGWAYRRVRHPLPGALMNALVLAWAVAVIFPMVAR
jgi:pimeloyl-ACP methyl ester carboxylesterase